MTIEPTKSADVSLTADYFERVYANDPDPWRFETSAYEHAKYARTLAALPRTSYACGLEIGCSIGVLTEQLAPRCANLVALDVNASALERARRRCARFPQIDFVQMRLPDERPAGLFDLILVSEVGYYWSRADLTRAGVWMLQALRPVGSLVLVHWTDPVPDYPLTGDQVHEHFIGLAEGGALRHRHGETHPRYRLDVFEASTAATAATAGSTARPGRSARLAAS